MHCFNFYTFYRSFDDEVRSKRRFLSFFFNRKNFKVEALKLKIF